jgi:hypothetical protein
MPLTFNLRICCPAQRKLLKIQFFLFLGAVNFFQGIRPSQEKFEHLLCTLKRSLGVNVARNVALVLSLNLFLSK